jgi:hypothetical protein
MRGAARRAGLGGARGGGHTRVFERLTGHWRLPARRAPQATVAVYFTSLVVMKKLVAWRGKSLDAELRGYVLGARFPPPPPQNAKKAPAGVCVASACLIASPLARPRARPGTRIRAAHPARRP